MKTRILKKINQRVRVVLNEKTDMWEVQVRSGLTSKQLEKAGWNSINQFARMEKAIEKKNSYIVMIIMRDLGYRNEFVKRRTKRKKRK